MANASTHTRSSRRSRDEKKRKLLVVPLDPDDADQLFKEGLIVRTGVKQYRLSGAVTATPLRFIDSKTRRRSHKSAR
jgi:hypothetical protein